MNPSRFKGVFSSSESEHPEETSEQTLVGALALDTVTHFVRDNQ